MLTPNIRRLLCMLSLSFAGAAGAAEPLTAVLDKVATAYGKTPPPAAIEHGTTTSFRRGDGQLLRMIKAPDRFLIRIGYANGAEVRTMIGPDAWQQGKRANPILRGAIALQLARLALPWNMLARRDAVTDLGDISSPEGKNLRVVEFPLEDRLKLVVEIEAESGRILRSRGLQTVEGNTMEFATAYSDFRSTGGRMHAARETHFAMGQHTGYSVIDRVEYPETIPDSAFAP